MSDRRQERVADLIRDEVSHIIQREMSDPRLGMVSITRVNLSKDLKFARLFVSVLGTEREQEEALEALSHAQGFIRRQLSSRVRMRSVPEISFRLDRSFEHAESIARILRDLEPELQAAAAAEAEATTEDEEPQ